jgi:hypothetical protein
VTAALRGVKPNGFEGRQGRYTLKTLFDALLKHEMRSVSSGSVKITDQHTRLAQARAETAELLLAEKKGKMVNAAEMRDLLELQNRTVTERLLVIPVLAADRIEPDDIVKREFARQVIYDGVIEALHEPSAPADLVERSIHVRETRRRSGRTGNGNGKSDHMQEETGDEQ